MPKKKLDLLQFATADVTQLGTSSATMPNAGLCRIGLVPSWRRPGESSGTPFLLSAEFGIVRDALQVPEEAQQLIIRAVSLDRYGRVDPLVDQCGEGVQTSPRGQAALQVKQGVSLDLERMVARTPPDYAE